MLEYEERGVRLDISASGRGLQQTLLLLAHLYANPNTVLLLDEPDAHLEILRQREVFRTITEVAEQQGSQIIAASHSEAVLNEAASKGTVVAFIGRPHLLNDRGSQLVKALADSCSLIMAGQGMKADQHLARQSSASQWFIGAWRRHPIPVVIQQSLSDTSGGEAVR